MEPARLREQLSDPPNLAFLLVVAAAYLSTFLLWEWPASTLTLIAFLALGVLYSAIGVFGLKDFVEFHPPAGAVLYLAVQIVLGGVILYLSRANAWMLLLPVSAQTVYLFSGRGVWAANAAILGVNMLVLYLYSPHLNSIFQLGVALAAAIFFVVIFTRILVREERARAEVQRLADELAGANLKLREYAGQVEELSAAQERNRLAREIHDGLGHYLTTIYIQIQAAAAVMDQDRPRAAEALAKAQGLTQDALADVRRSVASLRSDPALSRPLPEALGPLVDEVRATGVVADFNLCGEPRRLSPQVDLTLYRTVQEGLTNVRKHSLASRVEITLDYRPDSVRLTLQDNGVGLDGQTASANPDEGGFGLFGLRERAQLLGGTVEVTSTSGEGFRLEVVLPG